jgi:hypothetical protein
MTAPAPIKLEYLLPNLRIVTDEAMDNLADVDLHLILIDATLAAHRDDMLVDPDRPNRAARASAMFSTISRATGALGRRTTQAREHFQRYDALVGASVSDALSKPRAMERNPFEVAAKKLRDNLSADSEESLVELLDVYGYSPEVARLLVVGAIALGLINCDSNGILTPHVAACP